MTIAAATVMSVTASEIPARERNRDLLVHFAEIAVVLAGWFSVAGATSVWPSASFCRRGHVTPRTLSHCCGTQPRQLCGMQVLSRHEVESACIPEPLFTAGGLGASLESRRDARPAWTHG